jgi:hypothetical protein
MRIGAFEIVEPIPELNEPVALATLRPWVDVNNVGTLTLDGIETQFETRDLGKLARPGHFFDFTRYRPTLYNAGKTRRVKVPNTTVSFAQREKGSDFLFLHLLEPHSLAEYYIESILRLLRALRVKRYCLLGSMYDAVPHTRSLIVNGSAFGGEAEIDFKRSGALRSNYQGPTSITTLIAQKGPEMGIETMSFIVSLPQYVAFEEDFLGKIRLMEILNLLYDIPVDRRDFEKGAEQFKAINERVEATPELKSLLPQLETLYDLRTKRKEGERTPKLSPDIEAILWKIMGKDMGEA